MTSNDLVEPERIPIIQKLFSKKPIRFFNKVLGVDLLEDYQKKVIKIIWENDRVAIAACHDLGKTFLMARIAIAFMTCFKNSKVITTAPTFNQVERILWSELRAAHQNARIPLGGKLNMTDWTIDPDWFALGLSSKSEAGGDGEGQGTQSSFQGYHAPHVLVIFDEATGIPYSVWKMAEGLMTSANVKFVAIGNPTSQASEFYQCFKSRDWTKVYLTCFDSPNLIANGITDINKLKEEIKKYKSMPDDVARKYVNNYKVVRPYLLTAKWVVQQASKWGIDHPLTVSKILGKFPKTDDKSLVHLEWVEAAQMRTASILRSDRKVIGIDVARYGTDSTVLTSMDGKQQRDRKEIFKHDTTAVVGEAINMVRQLGGIDVIVVDETGLGGGVVDVLRDEVGKSLPKQCEVRGVQFGAACEEADDKEKFANMKARIFGLLREDIKASDGIALLNESIYLEELPTIRFAYNKKGQMVIESKDEYTKRTGRKSPDNSDSLALANFGHYDELKIGKFIQQDTNKSAFTHAGGLRSKRNW